MIVFPQYLCVKLEAEVYVKVSTEWESELLLQTRGAEATLTDITKGLMVGENNPGAVIHIPL